MEEECNNQINFLDLTIVRTGNRLEVGIFRKPTATNIMIHNESCHPIEHKIAGLNYLINRLTSCPITENNSQKEVNTINHPLKVNGYHHTDTSTLVTVNGYHHTDTNTLVTRRQQYKKENNDTVSNKWAVFTYTGKDTKFVTKLFKEFKVNVSYRTKNTIGNILTIRKRSNSPYDESGVCKLKCQNCSCIYIGQTGRNFKTRYKEHIQDIKNNRSRTGF
jgi:hypothetical protein